ncbi:hypothetical protein CEXT_145561 [Caerostris extrusa]|uniref:Uncharacterized protein n=1 Tax=Caerostris extrusa TaxID=172846 RepID=A0AAV4XVK2_CAEEX|nr:hypothetical protein CEXT_145561 [Caerostris extrusa]
MNIHPSRKRKSSSAFNNLNTKSEGRTYGFNKRTSDLINFCDINFGEYFCCLALDNIEPSAFLAPLFAQRSSKNRLSANTSPKQPSPRTAPWKETPFIRDYYPPGDNNIPEAPGPIKDK